MHRPTRLPAVLLLSFPAALALAQSSALVQINGTVYGPTCTLETQTINVPLPQTATYRFEAVGALVALDRAVDIVLRDCSTAVAATATFSFTGTVAGTDASDLRLSTGPVDALALKLGVPDGWGLQAGFVSFDGAGLAVPLRDGDMAMSFPVAYKVLQLPVPPGSVTAHASFTITYS